MALPAEWTFPGARHLSCWSTYWPNVTSTVSFTCGHLTCAWPAWSCSSVRDTLHWLSFQQRVTCLLKYNCLHGLAPDYLSHFCTLLTSVPGRPLLRSADANKLLVPRSCTASFGLRSFGSSGLTAWNDMPAHLRNLDLSLSDFRQLLKTAFSRLFRCSYHVRLVTVNLLIERLEISVYYYYYVLTTSVNSRRPSVHKNYWWHFSCL